MSKNSQIRWSRRDYARLSSAISRFNKKNDLINTDYKPENYVYSNVKRDIRTRQQYNKVLRELNNYLKEGAEELVTFKSGQSVTKWEYNKLINDKRIATRTLNKEIKELEKPYKSNFSKAQMGYQQYYSVLNTLRSIQKLDRASGRNFKRIKERVAELGNLDYNIIQATIYRQNFMESFEKAYKNREGYELIIKKFNNIKNPITFFNFIQKSNVFSDIYVYYRKPSDYSQGKFNSEQDLFNYGADELEMYKTDKERLVKKYTKKLENSKNENEKEKNIEMIKKANSIINFEDLLQFYKYEKRK